VEVEYDNQVMATLTVHLASPDWQEIDGKLVRKAVTLAAERNLLTLSNLCPAGSSQPRSAEEAKWYAANLGGMTFGTPYLYDADGRHDSANSSVTWLGAPQKTATYQVGGAIYCYIASCVWNQEILSVEDTYVEGSGESQINIPHGQWIATITTNVGFRCVVW
jgi:hypothetical protein